MLTTAASARVVNRNPHSTTAVQGVTGAVRWASAMLGNQRGLASFLASVQDAVAAKGLRSAGGALLAATFGPVSSQADAVSRGATTMDAAGILSGGDGLPGALLTYRIRGDYLLAVARARAFVSAWDDAGAVGPMRALRTVTGVPSTSPGETCYRVELGSGLVSDALLQSESGRANNDGR